MSAMLFVEGARPGSKLLQTRCREGFRKLLEKCGFEGRLPRIVPCGGREAAFKDFRTAHRNSPKGRFVALLVDSEDPVADLEQPWVHLQSRDGWPRPKEAVDDQVLLMTTCMETWLVAGRATLAAFFGKGFQVGALPSLQNIESRDRHQVQDSLAKATRNCAGKYTKGMRSFSVVAELDPAELRQHLPSFVRFERVLKKRI